EKNPESARRAQRRAVAGGGVGGVFFQNLAAAVTCGRCGQTATVGDQAQMSRVGSRSVQATVGGPPAPTVGTRSGRPQARHPSTGIAFLLDTGSVSINMPEQDEPTHPPTAHAPETADLGRAAGELRPQADGADRRLRPPWPAASGRQPWPS